MAIRNRSGSLQELQLSQVGVAAAPVVGCPMTVFTVIGFVQTTLLMLWAGLIAGSFVVRALSRDAQDTQSPVGRNSKPCPS